MKKIETNQETATSWSPFKVESKAFLQEASAENYEALIKSIVISNLGSYSSTIPYVVEGCVLSNSNKDISAGIIFYNGVFYRVSSISGGTAPLEFQLETVADGTADPTLFSDGSPHNIHLDYHFTTYSAGAAPTPSFSATNLVSLYGTAKINVCLDKITTPTSIADQTTTSTGFIDLTNATYTTPNDGITRKWMIIGKSQVEFTGSSGDYGGFRIMVDGVQQDENKSGIDNSVGTSDYVGTLHSQKILSIAPNKIVKLQIQSVNGGTVSFKNNSFLMVEL